MGDHALACARREDRIARHNLLRDLIFEAASSASLAPAREERHLLPGTAARPGDVFIRRWADGKDAALDVTVTSSLASSNLAAAAIRPGGALDKAYDRKNALELPWQDTVDQMREKLSASFYKEYLFISCEAILLSSLAVARTPTSCHLNLTV